MKMDDDADLMYGVDRAKPSHPVDNEDRRQLEEWAARLKLPVSDLEVFCRNGFHYDKVPPHDGPNRRSMLAHLKRRETPPSKWLLISGLFPELQCSETERRKRLRALYKAVVLLIRRALARRAADPCEEERSVFWDPVAEVCRDLEIAQSKLSSFCKEFSGHSLSQVVDCVRAERVKKVLRENLRAFLKQRNAPCATSTAKSESQDEVWTIWSELKKSRKWPEFSQNTWAMQFGFATYRRMYRACLAVYGQSPHQMEVALIRELMREPDEGRDGISEEELTLAEIEKRVNDVPVYSDEGIWGSG